MLEVSPGMDCFLFPVPSLVLCPPALWVLLSQEVQQTFSPVPPENPEQA